VIAVEALTTTVTCTDIHHARAKFFIAQLDQFAVDWSGLDQKTATGLSDGAFFLVTGRYQADTEERRNAFLESIGMSIVFLIDWNKARKSLRTLIDGQSAVRVLDWAARRQIGHRAYLQCGGADLVAAAVRHAASSRIGFGEQLAAVLGHDIALDFLKAVLRISMEGLRDGRSSRLVRDAIESELVRHLDRRQRHAGYCVTAARACARYRGCDRRAHHGARGRGRPVGRDRERVCLGGTGPAHRGKGRPHCGGCPCHCAKIECQPDDCPARRHRRGDG
jgi:hypothetical protein